jgi:hypothetical protein
MVYTLKLEQNKYYVGWSGRDDLSRIEEHFAGKGSKWTSYYKPIRLLHIIPDGTPLDEEAVTIWLAFAKGPENVRGGTYAYTGELQTSCALKDPNYFYNDYGISILKRSPVMNNSSQEMERS